MRTLNTKKQGDIGLGIAISYFVSSGKTVSIPLTDSQEYDLVVDYDGILKKVQVKTSRFQRNGEYEVMMKTCGGNQSSSTMKIFDGTKVDLLFIYTDNGDRYLIPTNSDTPKHSLRLGKKMQVYKI